MELMLNELSVHEQFASQSMLRDAFARIMTIRNIARRFGREVYCHRSAWYRAVSPGTLLVQMLSREQLSAAKLWLTRQGPFWDDAQHHDPNDLFECQGDIVTEAGLAEAAYCTNIGLDRRMVSFTPSLWEYTPLTVTWWRGDALFTNVELKNYWDAPRLESDLRLADPAIDSWRKLETLSRGRFHNLNFTPGSFDPLDGQPFAPGAAGRILSRLEVLDRLWAAGRGTSLGQQLYEDYFMGDRAWFSDSSDTEKRDFKQALTFPSPDDEGGSLFCTWHGKVNNPPYRIHFSWPIPAGGQIYIVYVGLKITRR